MQVWCLGSCCTGCEQCSAMIHTCLKRSRSSARSMEGSLAPMSSTLCLSKMPLSDSVLAMFRPVWPPMVGRIASGFSFSRICNHKHELVSLCCLLAPSGGVSIAHCIAAQ